MTTLCDITFKLNAPIFQFAHILDDRQSTTISTSCKCWVYQELLSMQLLSKHVIKNKKYFKLLGLHPCSKILTNLIINHWKSNESTCTSTFIFKGKTTLNMHDVNS